MMHTWFECKIRYEKVMENGMNKKVTEPYLVDALSFTEAEARIIEEITPYISGEFTVSDIKRANYSELFPSDEDAADRWFKCKLFFITLDEKAEQRKDIHYRIGTGFRPSRRCKETGRRNEGNNGRLCNRIRSRNRHHGHLSIRSGTECET